MADLEEIKAEIAAAAGRIARAEYERDTAIRAKEEALENLKNLGAESEEDAVRILSDLRQALEEELGVIAKELEVLE